MATNNEPQLTRGIDAHTTNPTPATRQPVKPATNKFDAVTDDTGNTHRNPANTPKPAHDTTPTITGQLEPDEGVAEQEKDPIE
jgi:hypothetical protein